MIDRLRQRRIKMKVKKGRGYNEVLMEENKHTNGGEVAMCILKDELDCLIECGWAKWIRQREKGGVVDAIGVNRVIGVNIGGKKYFFEN